MIFDQVRKARGTLDVISLQILFVFPASYNFSPEGHNARLRAITKGGGKNVVTVALSSDALGAMSTEFAIEARPLRGRTSSVTASPCHLPLKGKASLRIEILCQHNVGKAKVHSDHQNAPSRLTPAVGAALS